MISNPDMTLELCASSLYACLLICERNLEFKGGRTAIKPRSNSLSLLDKTVQELVHSLPARAALLNIDWLVSSLFSLLYKKV